MEKLLTEKVDGRILSWRAAMEMAFKNEKKK
jgi:hypothetical protein